MTTFSDNDLNDFLSGSVYDDDEEADGRDLTNRNITIITEKDSTVSSRSKAMWVPIIFLIVYFILVAMLWANGDWYKKLGMGLSPAAITAIWLVVFVGIVVTWVKCLKNSTSRNSVGWISFWFIVNLLLLLLCGWAFFVSKNIALANICFIFLWLSTIALIAVSIKHWPPGVIFMLIYFIVVTWAWVVIGRLAFRTVAKRSGKLFGVMMSDRSNRMDRLKEIFSLDGLSEKKGKFVKRKEEKKAEQTAKDTKMPDEPASDNFVPPTPRGTWRQRGLDGDE